MPGPPTYADPPMDFEHADLRDRMLADEVQPDLDALMKRTQQAISADATAVGRVRRLSTPARVALVLTVSVATAIASVTLSPRADLEWVDLPFLAGASAGMLVGALIGVALAMRPSWTPEASMSRAVGALVLALLGPIAMVLVPVIDPAEAFLFEKADLPALTVACFGYGTAIALVVAGVWRLVERRTHAGVLRWATAMAAAGAVGNIGLLLHCPVTDIEHKLIGHGAIGIVWAVLAAGAAWMASRRT